MKDGSIKPLNKAEQIALFGAMTKKKREKEAAALPPHIKGIRFDGSKDNLLLIDFFCSSRIGKQDIIRESLLRDHSDYVHSAVWNKLGDQLILILKASTRHDPNLRRRARGDLPTILSEIFGNCR